MADRLLNQRCRDVACPAKLWTWLDGQLQRGVVRHGENPEHVILLSLGDPDWAGDVMAWIDRIHAAPA